jgi:hypothetical protein
MLWKRHGVSSRWSDGMTWYDILKTNFVFKPDDPEGGHYDRTTGEVEINLANPEFAESMGISEEDFIRNLTGTLMEEYTHAAIDPEITEVFTEYIKDDANYDKTAEELAQYGHLMHEIGANAGRGYSPLGTWLMVLGHNNISIDARNWIIQNKLPELVSPELENNIKTAYTFAQIDSMKEGQSMVNIEKIIEKFEQFYGEGIKDELV